MNRKKYIAPSLQVMEVKPSDEIMEVAHTSSIPNGGENTENGIEGEAKKNVTSNSDNILPTYSPWCE